jgi:hypothetical protein
MKKYFAFVLVIGIIFGNCSTPFPSVVGITTQHVYDLSNRGNITSNKILKSGESCSFSSIFILLFFYGAGNSVKEAADKGGITKIALVDRSTYNILGPVFYKECTIAWGE